MKVVDALTEWRARRWLTALESRLGDGLVVAASVPGLAAVVDQHAAAARDLLRQGPNADDFTARVLLAGYGRGLLDRFDTTIDEIGAQTDGRWMQADWLALRMLAVCALAQASSERAA